MKFDKEKHEYTEKGKVLISVTQLLKKHGLATDFSMVDPAVLKAKGERGTLIHKEIEDWIKDKTFGFTEEFGYYRELISKNALVPANAEVKVHNDIVAGTLDQWGYAINDNKFYIGDVKTGDVNANEVRWQLSLYDYLLPEKKVKAPRMLICFDLKDNKLIKLEPIPRAEIDRLMDCERKGEIYKQEIVVTDDKLAELVQLKYYLDDLKKQGEEAERKYNEITETVRQMMSEKGIKTFENEIVRITYIAPTTRETIDTKKLKAEEPEIAAKYTKTAEVKDSVRITWRKEE